MECGVVILCNVVSAFRMLRRVDAVWHTVQVYEDMMRQREEQYQQLYSQDHVHPVEFGDASAEQVDTDLRTRLLSKFEAS